MGFRQFRTKHTAPPNPPGAGSIAISIPVAYQTSQQNGSGQGTIHLVGTYSGTPVHIEADWNGSGFALISNEVISAGNWSGDLINMTRGQGTLTVRFSNDTSVTAIKAHVGIGDVYVCAGDSIARGALANLQTTTTFGSIVATCYVDGGAGWQQCDDPTVFGGGGSFWPLLGSLLVRTTGTYPVAFINVGVGSTGIYYPSTGTGCWVKGQACYTAMMTAIANASLVNPPKGCIVHLGANDAADPTTVTTQAGYLTLLTNFINNFRSDYPNATVFFAQLGNLTTGSPPDRRLAIDNVRAATTQAWAVSGGAPGPVLYDLTNDGVHYTTNVEGQAVADRWSVAVANQLYSGTGGRGPRPTSTTIDATKTIVTINWDRALGNVVGTSDLTTAFRVEDAGTAKTISSAINATSTATVLQCPAVAGACTVDLGSQNDANNVTIPTSADITLPDARTIRLPAETMNNVVPTAAGGSGSASLLVHPGMTGRMAA